MSFYSALAIAVFISLSTIGMLSFSFYLDDYSSTFSEMFRLQNINLIESSNTLELGARLEAAKKSGTVKCILAKTDGHVFYQFSKTPCAATIYSRLVTVKATGRDSFSIDFEIELPWKMQIMFAGFLVLNLVIFFIAYFWIITHERFKLNSQKELSNLAKQVAHDIRSPLSALAMVTGTLTNLPEEKRLLIKNATQRINDIANDLLSKSKNETVSSGKQMMTDIAPSSPKPELSIELIPAVIDSLISEKRMQYREHSEIDIEIDLSDSFGSFAKIVAKEFKRTLSNLVNNSVEAFEGSKGKITVSVRKLVPTKQIEVIVKDNGKGIPAEIVSKLGRTQMSYGKGASQQSGSGIGLYHAKQTIESIGGQLSINSIHGKGTEIKLILPMSETPIWFAEKVDLTGKTSLISLDDDVTIHQIWSERLARSGFEHLSHQKIQSGEIFAKSILENINQIKNNFYLVDFELLNQNKTGLDLIEELGIEKHSILVTSRYEENDIQRRAQILGLKILPKSLAGFVPFVITKPKQKYDFILLDDDSLVHLTWQMTAKENGKSFRGFSTGSELKSALFDVDPESNIYIDSNLSNGEKGEIIAQELFVLGYKNLYLATGYDASEFKHVSWIKGIVGKEMPLKI